MERFVRGDKSRHTEGSGLGLSIAKSLTQIQGGEFDLTVDGDFFKVVLKFPVVQGKGLLLRCKKIIFPKFLQIYI